MLWTVVAYSQEVMGNVFVEGLGIAPGLVRRRTGVIIATAAHIASFGWCFGRDFQGMFVESC